MLSNVSASLMSEVQYNRQQRKVWPFWTLLTLIDHVKAIQPNIDYHHDCHYHHY